MQEKYATKSIEDFILEGKLSANEKLVLLALVRLAGDGKRVRVKRREIGRLASLSVASVKRAVKGLEEKGWIRIYREPGEENEYELLFYDRGGREAEGYGSFPDPGFSLGSGRETEGVRRFRIRCPGTIHFEACPFGIFLEFLAEFLATFMPDFWNFTGSGKNQCVGVHFSEREEGTDDVTGVVSDLNRVGPGGNGGMEMDDYGGKPGDTERAKDTGREEEGAGAKDEGVGDGSGGPHPGPYNYKEEDDDKYMSSSSSSNHNHTPTYTNISISKAKVMPDPGGESGGTGCGSVYSSPEAGEQVVKLWEETFGRCFPFERKEWSDRVLRAADYMVYLVRSGRLRRLWSAEGYLRKLMQVKIEPFPDYLTRRRMVEEAEERMKRLDEIMIRQVEARMREEMSRSRGPRFC